MTREHADRGPLSRDELAQLVARDIPAGAYVNLGIGQPTRVADYLDPAQGVVLHTENGMLGMGPEARGEDIDPDLINAGKIPVTELPGAAYFHHADSFAMMRGGHLDVCVLGNPVLAEDLSTVLALLDERRNNLSTQRTRLVNQLHAMFRDLVPGGAPTDLTATIASGLLTRVRPAGPVEAARKQLARDLVAEIRDADQRLKALTVQIADTVAATGSRLTEVDGVGPVVAARLLARTRRASRFPTAAAFASYAGVAPVEVSSAERVRHRLPRGGDRQLNFALHIVALTQVRMRSSSGRAYYDTKIAAGKTHNEAMRCLKRRLADHLWRLMIRDEGSQAAGPGGHQGATLQSSAAGSTPTASSSEKSLPEPATPDSTTGRSAA